MPHEKDLLKDKSMASQKWFSKDGLAVLRAFIKGGDLKRLMGKFLVFGIGDFLQFGLSYFILIPMLTTALEPAEYAVVPVASAISVFLIYTLQLGLPSTTGRYYFLFDEDFQRKAYFRSLWLFSMGAAAVLGGVMLLWGEPVWNLIIREMPFWPYAPYLIVGAVFQMANIFRGTLLRVQLRARLYVAFEVGQFVCVVMLTLWQVAGMKTGALGQVMAVCWTYVFFGLISMIFLLNEVGMGFKWAHIRQSLSFAFPVFLTYFIGFFQGRANVLIVQFFIQGSETGLYGLGQQFGNLIQMMSASFEKAWQPNFFSYDREKARKFLARVVEIAGVLLLLAAVGMGLFSQEVIGLLSSDSYLNAWVVVAISAVASSFLAISSMVNGGVYYEKRSNYSSVGVLIGAVSNVIFSMIFLQFWGGTGAALAALLANFLTLSFMARGEHRFFGAPVHYGKLALSYRCFPPA